jgi:phosphopantothenoylcysteine synthetase/decarboxylase
MHFLITAGGTREYIDPVRFISNASSGKMGYALAMAAIKAGHGVTLITTTEKLKVKSKKSKLRIVQVETAAQMFKAVKKNFSKCDCLIMAAAVADYTPTKKSKTKVQKSNKNLVIKLKPTVDILNWAGQHKKKNQVVVGFALEDKNIRRNAEKKLKEKNLDMIIANSVAAIGSDKVSVQIKMPARKWLKLPSSTKTAIAGKIVDLLTC